MREPREPNHRRHEDGNSKEGEGRMNDKLRQAREDYFQAKLQYGLVCNTEWEAVAYHRLQEAWERLRAIIREVKGGVA
jgi:outer membrane protein TolC